MSGYHGLNVDSEHVIACIDPIGDRTDPEDWVPFDKENVAGENELVVRDIRQNVALGVARANLF